MEIKGAANYDKQIKEDIKVAHQFERAGAMIDIEVGDSERGAAKLESFLKTDPLDGLILVTLSEYFVEKQQTEKALMFLERAASVDEFAAQAERRRGEILALRGDPPEGSTIWEKDDQGFNYGIDLVRYIRKEFGDNFFIGVGGYPESHQEQNDIDLDISFLKKKVDAGSDIIITQLFYDVDNFLIFRDKCFDIGIDIPIIPGIMPINNYARFNKFTQFCKVSIPESVTRALEPIKNDDSSVIDYGIEQATNMCQQLIAVSYTHLRAHET